MSLYFILGVDLKIIISNHFKISSRKLFEHNKTQTCFHLLLENDKCATLFDNNPFVIL